jgi:hypothetical protein
MKTGTRLAQVYSDVHCDARKRSEYPDRAEKSAAWRGIGAMKKKQAQWWASDRAFWKQAHIQSNRPRRFACPLPE